MKHFTFPDLDGVPLTILVVVLALCSWAQPLHFLPWVSWHSEVLAFVVVALFANIAAVRRVKKGAGARIDVPILALPFLGLALLAIVQATTGLMSFAGDALVFVFYMALCVTALVLGFGYDANLKGNTSQFQARESLEIVAFILLVAAFVSAVVAFAQVLELWQQSAWINRMTLLRRPGGNLGQANQLATLLLMGMVSLLFLYETAKLRALSSGLIFLVLCTAMAMTESRTGVLSFLLLLGWWLAKNRWVGFKLSFWVAALASIGFLGLFWAWPSIFDFLLQGSGSEVDTKAGLRLVVWPQLLEALALRPWVGWGLNQVPKAHNAVAHAYLVSDPFSYSHNILLDLALGVGLPLTVLLALLTGVWLWRRIRHTNELLPWYCIAVVLPMAVHSMLEFPFTYAYFLAPVMFALGVLEGLSGAKPAFIIGVRPAAALLFVISAVAAWSVVEYIEIEEDFRVARFEALSVGQTPVNYQRPHIVLLTQLDALVEGARIIPKSGMSPSELELAEKVALRYPSTATQNRYALSLALNGNFKEALRQLRVMRALHGEKDYAKIRENWNTLAQERYPQLRALNLP